MLHSPWDLSSPIRDQIAPPAVGVWNLTHWTMRDVLKTCKTSPTSLIKEHTQASDHIMEIINSNRMNGENQCYTNGPLWLGMKCIRTAWAQASAAVSRKS